MIRDATEDDIESLLPMAEKFWQVAGYAKEVEFDYDSTRDYFEMALDCGLLAVAEQEEIIGFVAGIASRSMVNRDVLVGCELAWWVEPEHRHSKDSIKLLKYIEDKAKEAGCKQWSMMCLEAQNPDDVEKMYLRLGYTKAERTYVKSF